MIEDFTSGSVENKLPANAGDMGSIPGSGRFPGNGAAIMGGEALYSL